MKATNNSIWMRLGVSVFGSTEDIGNIIMGDEELLAKLLREGKFEIDGESYIPGSTIEAYNQDNNTLYDEGDVELNLNIESFELHSGIIVNEETTGHLVKDEILTHIRPEANSPMFIDEKTQNTIHATLDNSVSHGTMRYQDLIPAFMDVLRDTPEYVQLMDQPPSYAQENKSSEWWESEDAVWLFTGLLETLEQYAPEGYTFGTHPGDGSDYGYWKVDSSEDDSDTLESILKDTDRSERFASIVLDEIQNDEEQLHHIGSNIITAYQNGDCDAMLIALCGWSMDSLLDKFKDDKSGKPTICPECQEETLKYAMIDIDGTNLEEGYSCSECGANFVGLNNGQVIEANF